MFFYQIRLNCLDGFRNGRRIGDDDDDDVSLKAIRCDLSNNYSFDSRKVAVQALLKQVTFTVR